MVFRHVPAMWGTYTSPEIDPEIAYSPQEEKLYFRAFRNFKVKSACNIMVLNLQHVGYYHFCFLSKLANETQNKTKPGTVYRQVHRTLLMAQVSNKEDNPNSNIYTGAKMFPDATQAQESLREYSSLRTGLGVQVVELELNRAGNVST